MNIFTSDGKHFEIINGKYDFDIHCREKNVLIEGFQIIDGNLQTTLPNHFVNTLEEAILFCINYKGEKRE